MRDILSTEELTVPEGVTVQIKSRQITVEGPRGKLVKNVRHVNMDIQLVKSSKENQVTLAVWQGGRKHVACLRTIKSLIENMITGVTKVRWVVCDEQCGWRLMRCMRCSGLPLQDACGLCPFPDQLHYSGRWKEG
jgi:hypothetical protein